MLAHLNDHDPPLIVGRGYSPERLSNAVVAWSVPSGLDFTDVNKDIWKILSARIK